MEGQAEAKQFTGLQSFCPKLLGQQGPCKHGFVQAKYSTNPMSTNRKSAGPTHIFHTTAVAATNTSSLEEEELSLSPEESLY